MPRGVYVNGTHLLQMQKEPKDFTKYTKAENMTIYIQSEKNKIK
jgi:hypothetical protein